MISILQVHWIDFGYTEWVQFKHLSAHIDFADIPVQVRRCHLSNVILISDKQTQEAKAVCTRLICNQLCGIYIHDNADVEHHGSIACSIQSSNVPLDLSSLLISHGLVQHKAHSEHKNWTAKFQAGSKRIRKESDEPITKNSSELHNYEDFCEFYRTHKAKNPMFESNDNSNANDDDINGVDNDNDSRIFEVFEPPNKRSPLDEDIHDKRTDVVGFGSHPMVDCITEHFKLMTIKKSAFDCRCVFIVDPVTILIEPLDVKPLTIDRVEEQTKYFPLQGRMMFCTINITFQCLMSLFFFHLKQIEKSPVIAYEKYAWHRGIVWKKLSTNIYMILFVDTLQIIKGRFIFYHKN